MKVHINYYGLGKPLVFFHGWGFNQQIWLSLLPYLEAKYQIILVDLPGFGLTPLMDWAEFKEKLLDNLPHTFALIGWSMGGLYATRMSIEEPSRVSHLLSVNSSPRFLEDHSWSGIKSGIFEDFFKKFTKDSKKTLKEFVQLQTKSSMVEPLLKPLPSLEGLNMGLEVLNNWDFRVDLTKLTQPVGFMFGSRDRITPVSLLTDMQKLYPNFKYILFKHAAHMPFISHPDLFIAELEAFIS